MAVHLGTFLKRLTSFRQPWTIAWNGLHSQSPCLSAKASFELKFQDNVAVVNMNANETNLIDNSFLMDMNTVLDTIESNKSCLAMVTMGGKQFYSNGFHLEWMKSLPPEDLVKFIHDFKRLLKRVLLFPMPTLAVLNGHTYAAGSFLAFAHDIRTMSTEKAFLSFTAVRENRRVSGFIRDYLRIKLGGGKNVADALVLARRYTGKDAHKNLLVHAAYPEMSVLDHSLQILGSFLAAGPYPREGIVGMKTDVYQVPINSFDVDLQLKNPFFCVQYMTQDQLAKYKAV
ncbi:hypothetical protein Btru_010226 [Bulinus truncatus]|nr:hypothetical protein Btru_010226 [Bulinus truncatus]